MPRPRKHAETIVKSFSLERQVYERLKQALAVWGRSISEEVNRLIKLLQKDGTYNQLMEIVAELGLDTELNNANEVIAKLLHKWTEDKTALHIFITLIETSKHKKAIERKLEQIRLKQRFND